MSPPDGFHDHPFDDGTLTKLRLFQLYTREWLPVFLSKPDSFWTEVHVYDFFAGPGTDSIDVPGSPLRVLEELGGARTLPGWSSAKVVAHFFDEDARKVRTLRDKTATYSDSLPSVSIEIEPLQFADSLTAARKVLARKEAAKLVLIDQYGVDFVSDDVFKQLTSFPTCDVLFFVSSSTLHRFREHPAIKQKIERPDDYYHVHRKVVDYYRTLIPTSVRYFLGGFDQEGLQYLWCDLWIGPSSWDGQVPQGGVAYRRTQWRGGLRHQPRRLRSALVKSPASYQDHGLSVRPRWPDTLGWSEVRSGRHCGLLRARVLRQHAEPVLKDLKEDGTIDCSFRVPDIDRLREPRMIRLLRR